MKYPKPNRENIAMFLVEQQMLMIDKTFEDAENTPQWFHEYSMTQDQFLEFKKMAIPTIKKVFRCNKRTAENNFDWWNLNWGLRIYPIPENALMIMSSFHPIEKKLPDAREEE